MNNTIKLSLALALALPLAACSENKAATTMKDAAASATAGIEKMAGEFSKMTEGQMGEVTKSISELESKVKNAAPEKKAEVEGLLKSITAKKDELVKMLGDVKGMAAGAGLDGIKDKLTNGITEIKKMIEDAMAKLK